MITLRILYLKIIFKLTLTL